ncbi:MAG: S8 family serine peptidase, partial [Pseudobdellovibrionaceae bacterium]
MNQKNRNQKSWNKKIYSRFILTFFGAIALVIVASMYAGAQKYSRVSSDLLLKFQQSPIHDVIVHLDQQANLQISSTQSREERLKSFYASLTQVAASSQRDLIQWLDQHQLVYRSFYIVNAIAVRGVTFDQLMRIASRSEVRRINLDPTFLRPELPSENEITEEVDPINPNEIPSSLKAIGMEKVWNELKVAGQGIVVAGQDTGYAWQHEAITAQYRGNQNGDIQHNYNWHDAIREPVILNRSNSCGYNVNSPCDDSDHGTHTMGTILGFNGKKERIGVAPKAQWIGCRNMDAGAGKASTYIECFEYFLAPYAQGGNPQTDGKPELAPHIINNSWGCPESEGCKGEEFLPIIRTLTSAGIMVVAAAGNDGPGCETIQDPPAFLSNEVITVASFSVGGNSISSFSSRGPSQWQGAVGPNITAPGAAIRSAVPGAGNNKYQSMSGTSMAS